MGEGEKKKKTHWSRHLNKEMVSIPLLHTKNSISHWRHLKKILSLNLLTAQLRKENCTQLDGKKQ